MNNDDDLFKKLGIEIKLKQEEDFLKVRETLTRIGVASKKDSTLYQSCHILHKQGRYAIMHFKELFILDGKTSTFEDSDLARRNAIVMLLLQWGLVDTLRPVGEPVAALNTIKIIPHKEKAKWNLVAKYTIGKSKKD